MNKFIEEKFKDFLQNLIATIERDVMRTHGQDAVISALWMLREIFEPGYEFCGYRIGEEFRKIAKDMLSNEYLKGMLEHATNHPNPNTSSAARKLLEKIR